MVGTTCAGVLVRGGGRHSVMRLRLYLQEKRMMSETCGIKKEAEGGVG